MKKIIVKPALAASRRLAPYYLNVSSKHPI